MLPGMKNLVFWIFVAVLGAATVATGVHYKSIQHADERIAQVQPLYEKKPAFPELKLAMEKYRRASGNYRKMFNPEIADSKAKLRGSIATGLAKIGADSPLARAMQSETNDLLQLSAKYEPQLFLKDAYQKPDVVELHETILKDISALESDNDRKLQSMLSKSAQEGTRSVQLMVASELVILVLVIMLMVRSYLIYVRPESRLAEYAKAVANGQTGVHVPKRLTPELDDVASTLFAVSNQVAELRDQRHKFIEDVIEDLRPGLAAFKRAEDLNGAVNVLSGGLDDLKQLTEISRMEQRLSLSVVDLSELLTDTCRRATLSGVCPKIRVSLPGLPTWVRVDAEKMERVMIQILSRMGEGGGELEAALVVNAQGKGGGVDMVFQPDGERQGSPDQEVTRHWIGQKGLSLMLAHRMIKAHGGNVFASGLTGSPVKISIKLPKSILTDGLVSPGKYIPTSLSGIRGRPFETDDFNSL
jgi:hypothetical protein